MGHVRAESPLPTETEAPASGGSRLRTGLEELRSRVRRATGSIAGGAARGRERAAEAAGGLRRPAPLRHGLAAVERGNLEAALALLREAVELAPDDSEAVLGLWNVALSCERPQIAAPAMAYWIHAEASAGRRSQATSYWIELAERVPAQSVDAGTLVRLLPELRRAVAEAEGAEARGEAEAWLLRALRQSVAPETPGLTPGLALRVFEQARLLDIQTARRAGEVVLAASDLHETKRQRIEMLLAQLGPGEATAAARETTEVVPVELREGTLIVRAADGVQRSQLDLRSLEAVAVAEVTEPEPELLIDLVLRRAPRARVREILRMRASRFDPGAVLPDPPAGGARLEDLLAALLDRSGALPLPDPDSALGIAPRHFDSLETYENAVLAGLDVSGDRTDAGPYDSGDSPAQR